jgi:adenine-specific DNA-methyltransferase
MKTVRRKNKKEAGIYSGSSGLADIINTDPYQALGNGKLMAREWAKSLPEATHLALAQTFIFKAIEKYWANIQNKDGRSRPLPYLLKKFQAAKLDKAVAAVADAIGAAAARLPLLEAGYQLGTVYTVVLPETTRSITGVFYTPPVLTNRLLNMSEQAGINWHTARIIDPACGGGAFLAPVSLKIAAALADKPPLEILRHIETHLVGWELDPFGAWLSQVFLEVALKDLIQAAGTRLAPLVQVRDSLESDLKTSPGNFDLVIGNPPYGKLTLNDRIRTRFKDSLYGHPNYYGLFTHLAIDLTAAPGVIAFLTPTSFLSGEYFKKLRSYIRQHCSPREIDFITFRKGVFEDVLQETMLATYSKPASAQPNIKVNQLTTTLDVGLVLNEAGLFPLGAHSQSPWLLPRSLSQSRPVRTMMKMTTRLADWGYSVSTGPLVWNRHKKQLTKRESSKTYPIIWAESVLSDGRFTWKAEKRNHLPFFRYKKGDDWLISTKPCILLQRTTAKEQNKRLIAAAVPEELLAEHGGIVIENHLNMVIPIAGVPAVKPQVLAAFLNSAILNEAFRAMSGSVAVSAYELESLPLPVPERLKRVEELLSGVNANPELEATFQEIFYQDNE